MSPTLGITALNGFQLPGGGEETVHHAAVIDPKVTTTVTGDLVRLRRVLNGDLRAHCYVCAKQFEPFQDLNYDHGNALWRSCRDLLQCVLADLSNLSYAGGPFCTVTTASDGTVK